MYPYPYAHPPQPIPQPGPRAAVRKNWIGTTALVAAVVGLALCWSVVGGVLLGAVAVGAGLIGRGRAAAGEADNRTVATSGIALGVLAVVVSLALVPAWVRIYRDVDVPAYLDCVSTTTDRPGAEQCANQLSERVDGLFGGAG